MIGDMIEIARANHLSRDELPPIIEAPSIVPVEKDIAASPIADRRRISYIERFLAILSVYIAGRR